MYFSSQKLIDFIYVVQKVISEVVRYLLLMSCKGQWVVMIRMLHSLEMFSELCGNSNRFCADKHV